MKKRVIMLICTFSLIFGLGFVIGNAASTPKATGIAQISTSIDTATNFFTQPSNKEKIVVGDTRQEVLDKGYKEIASNDNLVLYRKDESMGIALYDKNSEYMWYSNYNKTKVVQVEGMDTESVKDDEYEYRVGDTVVSEALYNQIESGVSIEYYDGNSKSISELEISLLNEKAGTEIDYSSIPNGFKAHLNFKNYGISFDVNVSISENDLIVDVPYDSIEEVTVGKLTPKSYQLKSISLFPYLGTENYGINGYAFIPDGSGALIRYSDVKATAAFIKKVYGNDEGVLKTLKTTNTHIVDDSPVSLPIYGINHGYNQAAFLCEIISGDGAAEIHSYPYFYKNSPLNTTFFRLGVRDTFMVTLSSSSMTLINEDPYPHNYTLKYSFLSNDKANYVGMAKEYASHLDLEKDIESGDIPLHLTALGLDYKEGLFGKNYIEMTTFEDTKNILSDLKENKVNNIHLSYLGWNKGGYFNNGAINAKAARTLGGTKDLQSLNKFIEENNFTVDYVVNPLVSDTYGYGNETIKGVNLAAFEKTLKSSLEQEAYYIAPNVLSDNINKKESRYEKLGIKGFNIDHLTDSFSYRYKTDLYSRDQMIEVIENELNNLTKYDISTTKPNSYLYRYISNYYEANYECSKFIYETDSIPFISILLSGSINLFTQNINYISDYNLFLLRMVEYNLYPSFIITEEEAYNLRFTNYEYLNSTEYALWKDLIIKLYDDANKVLKYVKGAEIVNHYYIENGVAVIEYDNDYTIYVNYNNKQINNGTITLEPYQYMVEGGSNA